MNYASNLHLFKEECKTHFPTPTLLLKVALKRYHSIRGLRHAPC